MNQFYSITPQFGELAGAAVTATTAATSNTLTTLNRDRRIVQVYNSTDQPVKITYKDVSSYIATPTAVDWFVLPVGGTRSVDFGTGSLQLANGAVIGVYNRGTPPTLGFVSFTAE